MTHSEFDRDREEGEVLSDRGENVLALLDVDITRSDDALLALERGGNDLLSKLVTGVRHREGGRTASGLGFDDLVTAKLDPLDERFELGLVFEEGSGQRRLRLRQERDDGVARVTADDGDGVLGGRVGRTDRLRRHGRRADDIERRDAKETVFQQGSVSQSQSLAVWG